MTESGGAVAGGFAVVPAEVTDAGRFVQQTAQTLIKGVRDADAEVEALMGTWRGSAADAYAAGWAETRKASLEVLDALSTMADLLGVAAVSYQDLDTARADLLRQTTLNLP